MRQQDITSLNFAFPTNRRMIVSRCCGMISAWSLLQHNAPILGLTPIFARVFHSWPWKSYVAVATCHSNCFTRFKKVQCWRLTHSVISVGPQLLCGRFWIQSMVILQVRMLSALLNVSHIDRHFSLSPMQMGQYFVTTLNGVSSIWAFSMGSFFKVQS